MVGKAATLIITSSVLLAQAPLLMVHLNVELAPTVNPVNPLVAEPGVVTLAVPAITLQAPEPVTGTLPASVAEVTLQRD